MGRMDIGEDYGRLDRLINERRLELGLKWVHVSDRAGIKPPTLMALRRGTNQATEDTKRGVERALHWEAGSVDEILGGGDPWPVRATEDYRRTPRATSAPPVAHVSGLRMRVPAPPLDKPEPRPGEPPLEYSRRLIEWFNATVDPDDPVDRRLVESIGEEIDRWRGLDRDAR